MVGVRAGEDYTLGRDLGHAFSSPHVAFYGRDGEAKGSEGLSFLWGYLDRELQGSSASSLL